MCLGTWFFVVGPCTNHQQQDVSVCTMRSEVTAVDVNTGQETDLLEKLEISLLGETKSGIFIITDSVQEKR